MAETATGPNSIYMFQYIDIYGVRCPGCGQECKGNELFIAVSKPYYALMHKRCVPLFPFRGEWPHPFPAVSYLNPTLLIRSPDARDSGI